MNPNNDPIQLTITVLFTLFALPAIYDAALDTDYLSLVQLYLLIMGLIIVYCDTHRLVDQHISPAYRALCYFLAPWLLYRDIKSHNKLVDTAMSYSCSVGKDAQIERAMLSRNRPAALRKEIKEREATFHAR